MANYGIGIGAFAQGIMQGMQLGKMYNQAKRESDAESASKGAMEEAKAAREQAVNAEAARIMGIGPQGPQGPQGPSPDAAPAQTRPVDMSTPQAAPLPDQGSAPAAAPAQSPQVPPEAMRGTPMADSATMAPAPTPAQAVDAARAVAAKQPDLTAATPNQVVASRGLPASAAPMTQEQARALAEKSAPSVMEFFQKKGVPKIAETYLAQGDPAKAQAWMDWAENAENKKNLKTWAKAWRATQMGDVEGAADHFMELYKGYDDGVTPVSKEVVKDKDGNITGFNVKLKNDSTGEERTSFIDKGQMLEMGLAQLAPPQMFEMAWKRQQTQDAAKAKAAEEIGKAKLKMATDTALEQQRQQGRVQLQGVKHENDLERDVQKGKIDTQSRANKVQEELQAKVSALEEAGYSKEFIRDALPQIIGVNDYKKKTSPEEAKRLAFGDRMKNDTTFAYKSADEQRKIIDQDMGLIYGGLKPSASGAPAPGKTDNPFEGGASAPPASRGLPVLDTKTGKIVYR